MDYLYLRIHIYKKILRVKSSHIPGKDTYFSYPEKDLYPEFIYVLS